ncbi:MAG: hypothetical protein DRJ51_04575 [Thermoprotei archaeon]|nr:MAG: hypothetical protein DRJ51_04575 [Thermoprotei archaeon]
MRPRIHEREWQVMNALVRSLTISEVSRLTGIPPATVAQIIKRLSHRFKISFEIDYRKIGLLPIALFLRDFRKRIDSVPPYTVTVRKLFSSDPYFLVTAIVPEEHLDEYLAELGEKPVYIVRGLERVFWTPEAKLTSFQKVSSREGILVPQWGILYDMLEREDLPVPLTAEKIEFDTVDLGIIFYKSLDLFKKIAEIARLLKEDLGKNYSRQLLLYHFKVHVLRCWISNTVKPFIDMKVVPMRTILLEGEEAPKVARILVQLPHFYSALIDEDKALITGQPLCSMQEKIYELISYSDARMPLGDIIMSSLSIVKEMLRYHELFREGMWLSPTEAREVLKESFYK